MLHHWTSSGHWFRRCLTWLCSIGRLIKKCHFVNLPFMTIDEVLLYEQPNVMPFMGMDIGDGFNFTLILVWGRWSVYIYIYICISHHRPWWRHASTRHSLKSENRTHASRWIGRQYPSFFLQFCGIAWIGNRLWKAKSMLSLGIDFHRATQTAEAFMATQDTHWIRFRIWKTTGPSNSCAQLGFSIELIQPGCRGFSDKKEDKHNWATWCFPTQINKSKSKMANLWYRRSNWPLFWREYHWLTRDDIQHIIESKRELGPCAHAVLMAQGCLCV